LNQEGIYWRRDYGRGWKGKDGGERGWNGGRQLEVNYVSCPQNYRIKLRI